MSKELQNGELYYPGGIGNVSLPDGRIGEITQIVTTKDGSSTLTICPKMNFKIPDYTHELLSKHGAKYDQQVTEDVQFEIIQPKQLI